MRRSIKCHRGVTAIEFALLCPVFLLLAYCSIALGSLYITNVSVHQLGADGVRATIGGINVDEKKRLFKDHVKSNASDYLMLNSDKIISDVVYDEDSQQTKLIIIYDIRKHPARALGGIIPQIKDELRIETAISEFG